MHVKYILTSVKLVASIQSEKNACICNKVFERDLAITDILFECTVCIMNEDHFD